MENNSSTVITEKNNRKRTSFNSNLNRIRTAMKVVSVFSIILAASLPTTYWTMIGFEDGNAKPHQAIIFIALLVSAIINLVFGVLTFYWALEKQDGWFVDSQSMFLVFFVLLTFTGAFLLGTTYIYIWWQAKRHWKNLTRGT